jgi:hypothetical protein
MVVAFAASMRFAGGSIHLSFEKASPVESAALGILILCLAFFGISALQIGWGMFKLWKLDWRRSLAWSRWQLRLYRIIRWMIVPAVNSIGLLVVLYMYFGAWPDTPTFSATLVATAFFLLFGAVARIAARIALNSIAFTAQEIGFIVSSFRSR